MFLPTNIALIFKLLLHIFSTADGYSVVIAGLKPTKEIIERDCRDPTFLPSYCPTNFTESEKEEDLTRKHSGETKTKIKGEMKMDCLGLPSDAEDCLTEPGNDYANERRMDTKHKKSKRESYGKKKSNKLKKGLTQIDTEQLGTYTKRFLSSNENEKRNKRIEERQESIGGEMEMECIGLPWDPQHCTDTTINTTKAPKSPKVTKAPNAPQATKATKASKAGKASKAPKAPKVPKAPKNPNTKYSARNLNNVGEIRGEAETECLGLPSDPEDCHDYANGDDYEMANGVDNEMANGDDYEMSNESDYEMANGFDYDMANRVDYDMANGDDYEMANGNNYATGKGNSQAAIVLKNNRLYLQFGETAEANNKYLRPEQVEKSQDAGRDYGQKEIIGGNYAWPSEFPWIVQIAGGCVGGDCGGSIGVINQSTSTRSALTVVLEHSAVGPMSPPQLENIRHRDNYKTTERRTSRCAGSLISPRLILSAFHCTYHQDHDDGTKSCDHSDGKRLAYLGRDEFRCRQQTKYYSIPIIDVKYPKNQGFMEKNTKSHDFALLVLKKAATYSPKIKPICLPKQDQDFGGKLAVAAGWGRSATSDINPYQSPLLRKVNLKVSKKKYEHNKIFGTTLETVWDNNNFKDIYKDTCSGDSGGPLMYLDPELDQHIIIGTVLGFGYDCENDTVHESEGSKNGLWNNVSAWVDWINKEMEEMGEKGCKAQEEYNKNNQEEYYKEYD